MFCCTVIDRGLCTVVAVNNLHIPYVIPTDKGVFEVRLDFLTVRIGCAYMLPKAHG